MSGSAEGSVSKARAKARGDAPQAAIELEAADLASIIRVMRRKYDELFGFPIPLMMILHQSAHFYVEFLPVQRSSTKLKYLAAVESASWSFTNEVLPEQTAAALRSLK